MTDTIGRGAAEAFDEIYKRNLRTVYRIAYMRLGNAADAEDAVQNVFLRYLRHPKQFDSEEHEKAYFIRAVRNESVNVLCSPWHSRRTDFDDLPERGAEDPYPDDTVRRALRAIPVKYREVLYLFYYEEYTTRQIAALLGQNESTVRTRLQTARRKLKPILREEMEKTT